MSSRPLMGSLLACSLAFPAIACGAPVAISEAPVRADVVSVTAAGEPGAYRFDVGLSSPDLGCEQYADWWEIVAEDGRLIHRRVLRHSHVDEQPFVRGGGPVAIEADEVVWVRGHMHPGGYGGVAFRGSVAGGFEAAELAATFAAELETAEPASPGCAF